MQCSYQRCAPRNGYLNDNISVEAIVKGSVNLICIKDVIHVSKLYTNLLLVSRFVSIILKVQLNLNKCNVKTCDGETVAIAPPESNLYKINFLKVQKTNATNSGVKMMSLFHHILFKL